MSIEFENKPLEWNEKGVEPPEELKNKGFLPSYKPPAAYFNRFMNKTYKAIDELQKNVSDVDTEAKNKDGGNADTVDGKHAKDLTEHRIFRSLEEALNTQFVGTFEVKTDYTSISGISLICNVYEGNNENEICTEYERIYVDEIDIIVKPSTCKEGFYYAEETYIPYTEWEHYNSRYLEFKGHTHTKDDIDKLENLKIGEDNKITVDFTNYAWDTNKFNGKPYENFVTNRVYNKLEDLRNPSFDKAYITFTNDVNVIPNVSEGSFNYWHIMHFPYGNGCSTQFAMPFGTNKLYTRSSKNNVWSDWVSLISSEGGTILYDDGDITKRIELSKDGINIIEDEYSDYSDFYDKEYGSYHKNHNVDITKDGVKISYKSRYNDENSDENETITITASDIIHSGDNTGNIRGFNISGYEKVMHIDTAVNWNTLNQTGLYHINTNEGTNRPPISNNGLLYVDKTAEKPFQLFIPDGDTKEIYKRSIGSNDWISIISSAISDVLGDKGADDFFPYIETSAGVDLNDLIDTGIYKVRTANSVNAPLWQTGLTYMFIMVFRSKGWTEQIAFNFTDKIQIRTLKSTLTGLDCSEWKGITENIDYNSLINKPESLKNPKALTIYLNGISKGDYDGSTAKSINITPSSIGAALSSHQHNANDISGLPTNLPANGGNADTVGGKSAEELQNYKNLTNKPTSLKNPNPLTISLNGTSQGGYDGSTAKSINITPSSIGAALSSHQHNANDISGLPTNLPANGGNADTVDGKHAIDFISQYGVKDDVDLNTIKEPGEYYIQGGSNIPENVYGYLKVIKGYNNLFVLQMFTQCEKESGNVYVRKLNSGVWGSWLKINDNGNADTVDGKHASELQNYNNLTNKPTSLKNPNSLEILFNGTNQGTYDGSIAKSINITPLSIGAAPAGFGLGTSCEYCEDGDLNDLEKTGFYIFRGGSKNNPRNDNGEKSAAYGYGKSYWWYVIHMHWHDHWRKQIAFPLHYSAEHNNLIFMRLKCETEDATDVVWTKWQIAGSNLVTRIKDSNATNADTEAPSMSDGEILMLYS